MRLSGKKLTLLFALISFIALSTALLKPSLAGGGMEPAKIEPAEIKPTEIEPTAKEPDTGIGDAFAGEELIYDMGFWIFKKIATGRFTMTREEDGTYKAVLDATSKARLFRSTRSTFTAYIKESADKKRFITLSFEKYSKKGKTVKIIKKELDHENGILKISKWKNGKFRSSEELEIPDGVIYDDPLSAFYNLRFGVYGTIEKDGKYLITTFPEKGKEIKIKVRIADKKALKKGVRKRKNNAKVLMKVKLAKELFDSSSGDIDLFFDENMIPVDVVAKNVLFFGDIYAKIKSHTRAQAKSSEEAVQEKQ